MKHSFYRRLASFIWLNFLISAAVWTLLYATHRLFRTENIVLYLAALMSINYVILIVQKFWPSRHLTGIRVWGTLMFFIDLLVFQSPFWTPCEKENHFLDPQYLPYLILLAGFHVVLWIYVMYAKTRSRNEIFLTAVLAVLHVLLTTGVLGPKLNYFVWYEKLFRLGA